MRTLYDKLFDDHVVATTEHGQCVLYIDRHLVEDHASPQAFAALRETGAKVRSPQRTLAVVDHNAPVTAKTDTRSRTQIAALARNARDFEIEFFDVGDPRQGITHVVGAEQGFVLPGTTVVCGDSHTSTFGAMGALAFGIGTSDVERVLRSQTLIVTKAKSMRIDVRGALPPRVEAKDLILSIIRAIGTDGASGYAIEFTGPCIEAMSMEERMTVCNMAVEAGAPIGLIAPDEVTFAYLRATPRAPAGDAWRGAVQHWKGLSSDADAVFDKQHVVEASALAPALTWGTSPDEVITIDEVIPDPDAAPSAAKRAHMLQALDYMGLVPGERLAGLAVDGVWIGSCTNGRIEDLRRAAAVVRGFRVAANVDFAMVVPGSGLVKAQAEREGLHIVFEDAGFTWSDPGCSMCLGMNGDLARAGQRCASTSNRNYQHRQGYGVRTHLMSPSMAAAAAITGRLTDVRNL